MDFVTLAELYTQLGFAGLVLVVFLGVFIWVLRKQMKTISEKNSVSNLLLSKIYDVLYEDNANNLTLQSAFDIIEAQCNLSRYGLIEAMMRIYFENNVHDPVRQKLIRENINVVSKNLLDRDIAVLSRLHYKGRSLSKYLETQVEYEKISAIIYENLLSKYKPTDIITQLNNEFSKIVQGSHKCLEEH